MTAPPQARLRHGSLPGRSATGDREFQIESRCELLPYLLGPPLGLSRKAAKDLLRFGAVQVRYKSVGRKEAVRHDTQLEPGDVVAIATGKPASDASRELYGFKIVHLDEAIVVVEKPAGLLSMGSTAEKERTAHRILNEHLKTLTKSRAQQIFIVHRLDRETSGLMVFARTAAVQADLQREWKNVTKKYLAVVEGALANGQGTLRNNLIENRSLMVRCVDHGGELAITHYRVRQVRGDKSLVGLTLETGRKHQIRVQLAAIGHPIIGDRKYGAHSDPVRRLALHSWELRLHHPVTGAAMEFRSALPRVLRSLMPAY
jgi:23S rRNA pseudouridine1911/1915/1917 synthase